MPVNVYVSVRALVINASNRSTYLRMGGGEARIEEEEDRGAFRKVKRSTSSSGVYRPVNATVNFDYTYGPFESVTKVAGYLTVVCSLNFMNAYNWTAEKQNAAGYECGVNAYDEMLLETKAVKPIIVAGEASSMIIMVVQALAWTAYLTSCGFDQNNSKFMKWLSYGTYVVGNTALCRMHIIPWAIPTAAGLLTYPIVMLVNFFVDDSGRRKKKNLPPVSNNYFYLFIATSTMWFVGYLINLAKAVAIKNAGATAASLVVNFLGIVFTFLFESLTVKASSPGNHGPFMFPFYFELDL